MRNGFTFYRSYYEAALELPDEQRLALYDAIMQYAIEDDEADLSGVVRAMFVLIKPTLDKSKSASQSGQLGGQAKRKRTPSETEANAKRNGSETEANAKRTPRDIDIDKDKDKTPLTPLLQNPLEPPSEASPLDAPTAQGEEDQETTPDMPTLEQSAPTQAQPEQPVQPTEPEQPEPKPAKPPKAINPLRQIRNSFVFEPDLNRAVNQWLNYKHERRQGYKPTGLKILLAKIQKHAAQYGATAVADVIATCIANNWAGIVWDKLHSPQPASPYATRASPPPAYRPNGTPNLNPGIPTADEVIAENIAKYGEDFYDD